MVDGIDAGMLRAGIAGSSGIASFGTALTGASPGISGASASGTGGIDSANTGLDAAKDSSFASALEKAYSDQDKEELKKACVQFESIMLSMMYKQMKATVIDGGLTEKSAARTTFEEMLDDELMNGAGSRGVGLADVMYRQLTARMDRTYKASDASAVDSGTDGADSMPASDGNAAAPAIEETEGAPSFDGSDSDATNDNPAATGAPVP